MSSAWSNLVRQRFGRKSYAPVEPFTKRRGVVLPLVGVMLFALLGMAALAVDVGYIYGLRQHAQNTADSAALAGASAIRDDLWEEVVGRAMTTIEKNQITRGFKSLSNQTVEIGDWDGDAHTFTPLTGSDVEDGNAVRVIARRHRVPLFFASIFGQRDTNVARRAIALVGKPCGGIWGLEGVDVSGNVVTDSYDSTEEDYSVSTAGEEGDVCSGRGITVSGSLEINGDVMASFPYSVTVNGSKAVITGTVEALTDMMTAPTAEIGDAVMDNDNELIELTDRGSEPWRSGTNFWLSANDSITLPSGSYYFESFTMKSGSTLTLTGPTTLFIAGDFDMSGYGIVNESADPNDLMIISTGSSFKMNGTVDFFGSVLAPFADVSLGGTADMYGAIIGKTVKMNGDFNFHVDESSSLVAMIQPGPPMLVQ